VQTNIYDEVAWYIAVVCLQYVLLKRFGAIDLHSKTQNRNWFRFF